MSGIQHVFRKKLVGGCLLLLHFLINQTASGQKRKFSFNSPGNPCYLNYIYLAAGSDYTQVRRPFIFILGSESESSEETLAMDTLRNYPPFAGYAFIYLAGKDFREKEKLRCLDALASSLTNGFSFGRSNQFLQVNNNLVTRTDINEYELGRYFKHIRLLLGQRGDKLRREIGSVSFSLFNVYNRNNIWYKEYILEEGEIIANSVSYFGIVPNVSISFKLR
jgi:hypothetical protein